MEEREVKVRNGRSKSWKFMQSCEDGNGENEERVKVRRRVRGRACERKRERDAEREKRREKSYLTCLAAKVIAVFVASLEDL